jgi:hypothetical protein
MSDPATPPLQPLEPHLTPIAEAFDQAERLRDQEAAAAAQRAEAERLAEAERRELEEDAAAIKAAFKRGGMDLALKVGRACKTSWTTDQVEELIYPPPPPREPEAGGAGGGERPPAAPPGGDEDQPPIWKLKKNPVKALPGHCPVLPLGVDGEICFYLTPSPIRQLLALESHSAEALRKLFAHEIPWLWGFIPKFKENTGEQTNWDAARTADSLIQACGRRGPFDPSEKLRGVGAWKADDGKLILHAGDQVFDGDAWREPGFLGEHVYPGHAPLPRPAEAGDDEEARAAFRHLLKGEIDAFLSLLDSWAWAAEFDIDPQTGEPLKINGHRLCSLLVLGWICTALVGGALDWRPMIWLTGDAATGKSTLQKLIAMVMGASLVSSSDATAAGIYQSVGYSSRAAGIDEAEADPFSTKMKGMVELVRQSASGGQILRGSNDPKKWRGFTARSSFLLSSIVIPPLFGQDLTRITILPLATLPRDAKKPKLEPGRYAALGRMLRRAILDGWHRWEDTLGIFAAELAKRGHDQRGGEQIGGLLAMATLVMGEELPHPEEVSILCEPFELRDKPRPESNAEQMLNWLISKTVIAFRGGNQMTIGSLVSIAAGMTSDDAASATSAALALQAHGVFVEGFKDEATVTLPNQSAGLAALLDGSPWGTRPGAAISGWQQAMQRLAAQRSPDGQPRGRKTNSRKHGGRGWSLPVTVFLRQEEE